MDSINDFEHRLTTSKAPWSFQMHTMANLRKIVHQNSA